MSTPSPELVAAAPTLIQGLTYLKQAVTTILTGDAALLPGRVVPAITILDNQLVLLLPQLANAEQGAVLTQATAGIDGLIARLNAAVAPTPPPAA